VKKKTFWVFFLILACSSCWANTDDDFDDDDEVIELCQENRSFSDCPYGCDDKISRLCTKAVEIEFFLKTNFPKEFWNIPEITIPIKRCYGWEMYCHYPYFSMLSGCPLLIRLHGMIHTGVRAFVAFTFWRTILRTL